MGLVIAWNSMWNRIELMRIIQVQKVLLNLPAELFKGHYRYISERKYVPLFTFFVGLIFDR